MGQNELIGKNEQRKEGGHRKKGRVPERISWNSPIDIKDVGVSAPGANESFSLEKSGITVSTRDELPDEVKRQLLLQRR